MSSKEYDGEGSITIFEEEGGVLDPDNTLTMYVEGSSGYSTRCGDWVEGVSPSLTISQHQTEEGAAEFIGQQRFKFKDEEEPEFTILFNGINTQFGYVNTQIGYGSDTPAFDEELIDKLSADRDAIFIKSEDVFNILVSEEQRKKEAAAKLEQRRKDVKKKLEERKKRKADIAKMKELVAIYGDKLNS